MLRENNSYQFAIFNKWRAEQKNKTTTFKIRMHSSSTGQFLFVVETIPVASIALEAYRVVATRKFIACSLLCVTVNHNKGTQTLRTRSLASEI